MFLTGNPRTRSSSRDCHSACKQRRQAPALVCPSRATVTQRLTTSKQVSNPCIVLPAKQHLRDAARRTNFTVPTIQHVPQLHNGSVATYPRGAAVITLAQHTSNF